MHPRLIPERMGPGCSPEPILQFLNGLKGRHSHRSFWGNLTTTKDRSGVDLTEAEDIKKRWQEYTEELYKKKNLHNANNNNGVITHLEPDILECEVK